APADDTERRLAHIWEQVLGQSDIGTQTSFFNLGGNSLKIIRMGQMVNKEFNTTFTTEKHHNGRKGSRPVYILKMKKPIAIIGMGLMAGDADNPETFWQFVAQGRRGFNTLSAIRQQDITDRFGPCEITRGGYLYRVDLFDHHYFNISQAEAVRMDQEQRLLLTCAVKAVHNAGYRVSELKAREIGVFHTYGLTRYSSFFDDTDEYAANAHHAGMGGARIAAFMDWRGPVLSINTACSSSLSALYYACESIAAGDCTMALAAGANLGVVARATGKAVPSVISQEGAGVEKAILGEGVFCFLLKDAAAAIRDQDPIHAVIRGGAINHAGGRSQDIDIPSPAAQGEVIRKAWKNRGTDPARIRFIETKGTGNIMGDRLEFSGLAAAFEGLAASTWFIYL
ncbi:hypothetical protein FGG08_007668, partial [Glutinoglossum americanum]